MEYLTLLEEERFRLLGGVPDRPRDGELLLVEAEEILLFFSLTYRAAVFVLCPHCHPSEPAAFLRAFYHALEGYEVLWPGEDRLFCRTCPYSVATPTLWLDLLKNFAEVRHGERPGRAHFHYSDSAALRRFLGEILEGRPTGNPLEALILAEELTEELTRRKGRSDGERALKELRRSGL